VNSSYSSLTQSLHSLIDQLLPVKQITITDSRPSFTTPFIKSLLQKRNKLLHKYQLNRANELRSEMGKLIAECRFESLSNVNPRSDKDLWSSVKPAIKLTMIGHL
jgi:hypothetical protein